MARRTKGLDRCSTADRSSATIEETNSSLAWTDISEAPIASGGSPLAQRRQDHSDAIDARVHLVVVDRIAARPRQPDLPQQPVERLNAALGASREVLRAGEPCGDLGVAQCGQQGVADRGGCSRKSAADAGR